MGEVITFYSYKGGTGRTMALANTAALAAQQTQGDVLMIDWDLEAPGLEHYFEPYMEKNADKPGVFEFIAKAKKSLGKMPYGKEDHDKLDKYFAELGDYLIPIALPGGNANLYLLKAGQFGEDYSVRINQFDWGKFFQQIPAFFPLFARHLSNRFEYVFIDSRTGHTDVGGICTMSMPEKLVLVFTPNAQSLGGVIDLAKKATEHRLKSDDYRPLMIYPLPSRVDLKDGQQCVDWGNRYETEWKQVFQHIYDLPATISLKKYFENVRIPHESSFAYGEKLAVLSGISGINTLEHSFRAFVRQLTAIEMVWEHQPFANITTPFEVFYVFAQADRPQVEEAMRHLSFLRSQNVIHWSMSQMLSVENWEETIQRKVASSAPELIVVFLSRNLKHEEAKWASYLRESINRQPDTTKVMPIMLDDVEINEMFFPLQILPSRSKPLSKWENQDEAWQKITSQLQREIIKINEKKQSNGIASTKISV